MTISLDSSESDVQAQPNSEPCTIRVLDRQELLSLGTEWEELVTEALEENAYYCRQYLEALLTHVEQKTAIKALVVYRGPRLIALLPYVTERWRWLGFSEVNMALLTPYTSLAIPLIDQRDSKAAMDALVTAMNDNSDRSNIWILPYVNLDGPVNRLLAQVLKKRGLPSTPLDVFDCPVLVKQGTFEEHIKNHATKNRRKGLARNRKRLAEIGDISEEVHTEGTNLDKAIEEFLRIEASGWKGQQGTALDCTSATRTFAKQAFGVHKGESITRAHLLLLDKRTIAASLSIQTGQTAFTIKVAYDETYRKQGVGLLLEENLVRDLLEGSWVDSLNSAATLDHPIQSLWGDTVIRVGDVFLSSNTSVSAFRFKIYFMLETTRRWAYEKVKNLYLKKRS